MKDLFFTRFFPMMEAEGNGGTGGTPPASEPQSSQSTNEPQSNEPPKTFTQEDLNRIAAQEKRQGMNSVLKSLGFEKEEDAKAFIEQYRKLEEGKKDELTKAKEAMEQEKKAKAELQAKAELLDRKFKVVAAGVPADKADDVVVLATAKLTDNKTFEEALEELKKSYPVFFDAGMSASSGTGKGGTPPRTPKGAGGSDNSIGKRLAEQRKNGTQTKKSYFSD